MGKRKGISILVIALLGFLLIPSVINIEEEQNSFIAKASGDGGVVNICINTQPEITGHDCSLEVESDKKGELRDTYNCNVNGTDPDGGNVTYHTLSEFAQIDKEEGYVTIEGNILEGKGEEEWPEEVNLTVIVADTSTCPNNNITKEIELDVEFSSKIKQIEKYPDIEELKEGRTRLMPLDDYFEDVDGFELEYDFYHPDDQENYRGCREISIDEDNETTGAIFEASYNAAAQLDGEPCETLIVAKNPFGVEKESNVFEIHVEEMDDPTDMDWDEEEGDWDEEPDDDTADDDSGVQDIRDPPLPGNISDRPPEDPPDENDEDPNGNGDEENGENGNGEEDPPIDEEEYILTIKTKGNGTTFPFPGERRYREGEIVEINPRPDEGWTFYEFSGSCSGENCTLNMTKNKNVTAHFNKTPLIDTPGPFEEYNITGFIIFLISIIGLSIPITYVTAKIYEHILKKQMEKMKERIIKERKKVSKDYVGHFEEEIKKLMDDFDSVTNENAKEEGDKLLKEGEASGYNIDRYSVSFDNDYADILNDDSMTTINYSMYMKDVEHGKRILQELANRGLRPNYKICKRSSAVKWDDEWENDGNAKIEDIGGEKIARTVEYIISFMPKDKDEARKIIKVLEMYGKGTQKSKIKGAWDVPDIRVTGDEQILDYEKTILNTKSVGGQKLMILTKDKPLEGYKHKNIWLNPELAQFIE